MEGNAARAVVPVAERAMDMLIYGNSVDENGVLVSTDPVTARAGETGLNIRILYQRYRPLHYREAVT